MASPDFTPLYRGGVGFEHFLNVLESATRNRDAEISTLPYNIEKIGGDTYCITIALAGFDKKDISVVAEPNLLTVRGKRARHKDADYLYQGITCYCFERTFDLADYIVAQDANLEHGLLTINLACLLPDRLKTRRIEIRKSFDPKQQEIVERKAN